MTIFHRIKNAFRTKIRIQFVFLLIFLTALPVIVLQVINIRTTSALTRAKDQEILDENLQLTSTLINATLESYKDVFFSISTDAIVLDNLVRMNKTASDTARYQRIEDALETAVISHILICPEIQGVGIISPNNNFYFYSQKREKYAAASRYFLEHCSEMNLLYGSTYHFQAGMIDPEDPAYDADYPSFFIGGGCFHYEKMRLVGTLILFLDPGVLSSILNNSESAVSGFTSRALFLPGGQLVCGRSGKSGARFEDISQYRSIAFSENGAAETQENQYVVSETDTAFLGFRVLSVIDYARQNRPLRFTWVTITTITFLILIAMIVLLYLIMGKQIIRPVERIAGTMNGVAGKSLGTPIRRYDETEFGEIERSYNGMLARIEHLLSENKAQIHRAYEAELKALELQINPHFLFNTLDTINWTALRSGADNVSELLTRLAAILRYTVYGVNEIVPIRSDIEWIRQYLELQRVRFDHKFTYDVLCPESASSLHMHKLLLEPILENSLIHGFDNIRANGYLKVKYSLLADTFLKIEIIDNGCGICEDELMELRRLAAPGIPYQYDAASSIGIANVSCRLHEYYPGSRILISSGHGTTCVKLLIPLAEMEKST